MPPTPQSAKLNNSWVFKIGAFALVALVFGGWAVWDATYIYPNRGLRDASFQLNNFIDSASRAGQLNSTTLTVQDPRADLAQLEARKDALASAAQAEGSASRSGIDFAKLQWLESLNRAWKLNTDPKYLGTLEKPAPSTLYFDMTKGEGYTLPLNGSSADKTPLDPHALAAALKSLWNSSSQVAPLSAWDLPVQWLFVVLGLGGGLILLLTLLRAKATARKITFDPESQRLTIPSGVSFTPADLQEVDKRRWHKFFVTMLTKDGGKHSLDLLRYVPLEEWVLTMERTAFPELAKEDHNEPAAQAEEPSTSH